MTSEREHDQRMALEGMASGIGHDLSNALSPILGFSEVLLNEPQNLDDKRFLVHCLQMINLAARDALALTRRLRHFYRPRQDEDSFAPVDLNIVIRQVIDLTETRWRDKAKVRGVEFSVRAETVKIPVIQGNETELREALINIVLNAIDAMPNGGAIVIRSSAAKGAVAVEVEDNGVGMSEEVRKRCMQPFFSTKGDLGTGLGLAMVQGILRRHGGSIEVESAVGSGTKFRLRFPIERELSIGAPQRRPAVLLVADEPSERRRLERVLKQEGCRVMAASGGGEGFKSFLSGWFDVVILDCRRSEPLGDHLAMLVKRAAPGKPIVELGRAGEANPDVDRVLPRGVEDDELRRVVTELAGSR